MIIVDYGMGNLRSVQKAFERLGHAATISSDPEAVARADKLVLPGVGAFCDAIGQLHRQNLVEPLRDYLTRGRPFLGVCLGLQLLFETGHEDGVHQGLGVFPGKVVRFELPAGMKVPHMGWNQLRQRRPTPLFRDVPDGANVYFVHSYYVVPEDPDLTAGETEYGHQFTSFIARDSVFAAQFHPEKSQTVGLTILRNFAEL